MLVHDHVDDGALCAPTALPCRAQSLAPDRRSWQCCRSQPSTWAQVSFGLVDARAHRDRALVQVEHFPELRRHDGRGEVRWPFLASAAFTLNIANESMLKVYALAVPGAATQA